MKKKAKSKISWNFNVQKNVPENEKLIKPIPAILMDDETDYEYDEYDNYHRFGIFQSITFALCCLFHNFFQAFKKIDISPVNECIVCFESFPVKKLASCDGNHSICGKCFRQSIKNLKFTVSFEKLIQGFPCSQYDCPEFINYNKNVKMIPRKTRQQLQTRIHETLIKVKAPQLAECKQCFRLEEITQNRIFYCSGCYYTFCYYCEAPRTLQHTVAQCINDWKVLKFHDKLSEALIHRCHRCKLSFLKFDGPFEACNIITCTCGASQCYACREPAGHGHKCANIAMRAFQIHENDIKKATETLPNF